MWMKAAKMPLEPKKQDIFLGLSGERDGDAGDCSRSPKERANAHW